MVISMLCWGSWANAVKMCLGYRFQLFYWDYVAGVVLGAVFWGFTLGSWGHDGLPFIADLRHADWQHILLAFAGGCVFNVANLLLVAAIDLAGLAVAFPVGIGLALVIGAVASYMVAPSGNPWLLFSGIVLVLAAIAADAMAYHLREERKSRLSRRIALICLLSGILMGSFYPLVARSLSGRGSLGPFAGSFVFAIGVAVCALPVNWLFMRRPLDGGVPVSFASFRHAPAVWHDWGLLGGGVWCTGAVMNFAASQVHLVGPAVSYSIGQGATMVSACWGVFVWKEFTKAPSSSKRLLFWMFLLFVTGLTAIATSPIL